MTKIYDPTPIEVLLAEMLQVSVTNIQTNLILINNLCIELRDKEDQVSKEVWDTLRASAKGAVDSLEQIKALDKRLAKELSRRQPNNLGIFDVWNNKKRENRKR